MTTRSKPIVALCARAPVRKVCNGRDAYRTEPVRDDGLNSLVGYGVAPNPPYKTRKVIE